VGHPTSNDKLDQKTLTAINDAVCSKIEDFLALLQLDLEKQGRYYIGSCPIHCGNNKTALNLYPEGYKMGGFWKCNTRQCHMHFAQNIIGFTRAVLSRKKFGWEKKGDREVSFGHTIDFLTSFIGNELKIDFDAIDRKRFVAEVEMITGKEKQKIKGIHRNQIRNMLEIPADEFIQRGYLGETLHKYDIGVFKDPKYSMNNRIIVPVYDDKLFYMGCQGRSIFPQCKKCEMWHEPGGKCPETKDEISLCTKWRNGTNFSCGSHLYNLWYAKPHIQSVRTIILVEGALDVWRLEEAGVHNAVGLFGANFSDQQEILIEMSGATTVIILTDNDETGNHAAETIKHKCDRLYNVVRPKLRMKDVGEYSIQEIREELIPIFKSVERKF
jgi:5S rRNA maturation endonuclease (ribonuclease M5)